jgi:hypothetical protein
VNRRPNKPDVMRREDFDIPIDPSQRQQNGNPRDRQVPHRLFRFLLDHLIRHFPVIVKGFTVAAYLPLVIVRTGPLRPRT